MASYANRKDHFDSDSGFWTDKTTSCTITFASGKKVFDKTADTWSSGHHFASLNHFQKGDTIMYKWIVDELNATNTYHLIALVGSVTPDYSGSGLGVYWYPDAQVKAHGQNGGGIPGTTSNPAGLLSVADIIFVRFQCTAGTGFGVIDIKGGPYADWTNVYNGSADISQGNGVYFLSGFKMFHGAYSSLSGFSADDFEWYDSGGPDSTVVGGYSSEASQLLLLSN